MRVSFKTVAAAGVILLALYGVNFLYAILKGQTGGTFGDTFGAVNALFSGSALLFLILAFVSQREELNLIKDERNETRKILADQKTLFDAQKKAIDKQVFEQSFFSLLSLLNQEKARLLRTHEGSSPPETELHRSSRAASDLLLRMATGVVLEPNLELALDVHADRCFNLVNLAASSVTLVESSDVDQTEKKRYYAILQGLIDFPFAVCFAWFNWSCHQQNDDLATAYSRLSIHFSLSPALRDAIEIIEHRLEKHQA